MTPQNTPFEGKKIKNKKLTLYTVHFWGQKISNFTKNLKVPVLKHTNICVF